MWTVHISTIHRLIIDPHNDLLLGDLHDSSTGKALHLHDSDQSLSPVQAWISQAFRFANF